jgi:hypothetical protein
MMSDSDIIDNVNPFVDYPPGAWSKPYPFSGYMKLKEEPFKEQENTPVCDMATTAGDRQIDWCEPGVPNCPMSRELEPTQRVDPDISYAARGDVPFGQLEQMVEPSNKFDKQLLINIIVLILVIIIVVKLTERL